MNVKLIICDWEGCVSEPGGGRVPWDTSAIAKLRDLINKMRKIKECPPFVLCTGRQFPYGEAALQATNAFWEDKPSILENGDFVASKKRVFALQILQYYFSNLLKKAEKVETTPEIQTEIDLS